MHFCRLLDGAGSAGEFLTRQTSAFRRRKIAGVWRRGRRQPSSKQTLRHNLLIIYIILIILIIYIPLYNFHSESIIKN